MKHVQREKGAWERKEREWPNHPRGCGDEGNDAGDGDEGDVVTNEADCCGGDASVAVVDVGVADVARREWTGMKRKRRIFC